MTQPLPNSGKRNVFEYVHKLLTERESYGVKTYGQPLMTHDGRDNERDEEEEMIDLIMYQAKNFLERKDFKRQLVERLLVLCPELTDAWLRQQVTPEALVEYVIRKHEGGFWK